MSGRQESFMEGLTAAARDNPLATALIGGGALWLLIGNEKLKDAMNSVAAATEPMADASARAGRSAAAAFERNSNRASRIRVAASHSIDETVRNAGATASEAMSSAADSVSERFDDGVAGAREMWDRISHALPRKETLAQAQSALSDLLGTQPLLLGAVGLAIGATVAGALAKSGLEDQWVGEFSDGFKADLNARSGAVSRSLSEAADTVKAELGDAGAEYTDRLQQAGRDAIEAAKAKN